MTEFVEKTAWIIEKPEAYGAFHLSFLVIALFGSAVAAFALRNISGRRADTLIFWLGVIMLTAEAYKQLFCAVILGGGQYLWRVLPFQLCSVPMYLYVVFPFLKDGRLKQALSDFMLSFSFMGALAAMLEPSQLLSKYAVLTVHSLMWHAAIVFVGLLLGMSGRAGRKISDFRRAAGIYLILCAAAFLLNIALRSKRGVNMFFISPYIKSPIIVISDIYESCGWYVALPVFMAASIAGAFAVFAAFCAAGKIREIIGRKAEKNAS